MRNRSFERFTRFMNLDGTVGHSKDDPRPPGPLSLRAQSVISLLNTMEFTNDELRTIGENIISKVDPYTTEAFRKILEHRQDQFNNECCTIRLISLLSSIPIGICPVDSIKEEQDCGFIRNFIKKSVFSLLIEIESMKVSISDVPKGHRSRSYSMLIHSEGVEIDDRHPSQTGIVDINGTPDNYDIESNYKIVEDYHPRKPNPLIKPECPKEIIDYALFLWRDNLNWFPPSEVQYENLEDLEGLVGVIGANVKEN